jgi:autotransporter translocation and assembly factor TamB
LTAWLPALAFAGALLGLARGVHHFYVAPTWSDRVRVMSTWSPLRLRELAVLLVIAGLAAATGVLAAWRAGVPVAASAAPDVAVPDSSVPIADSQAVNSQPLRVETTTTAEDGAQGA